MPRLAVQISRRLCLYLLGIGIIVIASSFASWTLYEKVTLSRHLGSGLLPMKMSYYKNHVDEFDMIFLGDSKSFCGMHPDQIDAEMGTNSFNISHWANWLPTQYALLGDLIDDIPEETHVVWSIGHINFIKGSIQPVYPIGLETVFYLKGMDYSLEEMLRAFISFEPSFALLGRREQGYKKIQSVLSRNLYVKRSNPTLSAVSEPKKPQVQNQNLLQEMRNDPLTGYINPWYDANGALISLAQYKKNGSYLRKEILPSYYRAIQNKSLSSSKAQPYVFKKAPATWELFIKILDMMQAKGVKVTVNVFEEAPYTYANPERLKAVRAFMQNSVAQEVTKRGFNFINVDFDQLGNEHYFDYNHLNSTGVEKFTELFVSQLIPMIGR